MISPTFCPNTQIVYCQGAESRDQFETLAQDALRYSIKMCSDHTLGLHNVHSRSTVQTSQQGFMYQGYEFANPFHQVDCFLAARIASYPDPVSLTFVWRGK